MDAPTYCMRPLLANFPNTREVISTRSSHLFGAQSPFPCESDRPNIRTEMVSQRNYRSNGCLGTVGHLFMIIWISGQSTVRLLLCTPDLGLSLPLG